tara:strand:- start:74 stop:496 length:423 start_codon:yes stop_codon:yes gene_type:complete
LDYLFHFHESKEKHKDSLLLFASIFLLTLDFGLPFHDLISVQEQDGTFSERSQAFSSLRLGAGMSIVLLDQVLKSAMEIMFAKVRGELYVLGDCVHILVSLPGRSLGIQRLAWIELLALLLPLCLHSSFQRLSLMHELLC